MVAVRKPRAGTGVGWELGEPGSLVGALFPFGRNSALVSDCFRDPSDQPAPFGYRS